VNKYSFKQEEEKVFVGGGGRIYLGKLLMELVMVAMKKVQ